MRSLPAVEAAPATRAEMMPKMIAKVRAMIAPTTRPARISQPILLRQRSHALANTSPIVKVPPALVVMATPAVHRRQHAPNAECRVKFFRDPRRDA